MRTIGDPNAQHRDLESRLPPLFDELINKYQFRANRLALIHLATGVLIFGIILFAGFGEDQGFGPLIGLLIGSMFIGMGLFRAKPNTRKRVIASLEHQLRSYYNPLQILAAVEQEIQSPFILGKDGAITSKWVITSDFASEEFLFPIVGEEVHFIYWEEQSKFNFRSFNLLFKSGRSVNLADSPTDAREAYDKLVSRFGPIPVSESSLEVLDPEGVRDLPIAIEDEDEEEERDHDEISESESETEVTSTPRPIKPNYLSTPSGNWTLLFVIAFAIIVWIFIKDLFM